MMQSPLMGFFIMHISTVEPPFDGITLERNWTYGTVCRFLPICTLDKL